MTSPTGQLRKLLVRVGLFLLVALLILQAGGLAQAAIEGCRGDPIVQLSIGTVRLGVEIVGSAENVESIEFTIHAPPGTVWVRTTYTGGALQDKEKVVFKDDGEVGVLTTETLVKLVDSGKVAVTATTSVGGQSSSVTGLSGKKLTVDTELP